MLTFTTDSVRENHRKLANRPKAGSVQCFIDIEEMSEEILSRKTHSSDSFRKEGNPKTKGSVVNLSFSLVLKWGESIPTKKSRTKKCSPADSSHLNRK
jgi:hypothetical protein